MRSECHLIRLMLAVLAFSACGDVDDDALRARLAGVRTPADARRLDAPLLDMGVPVDAESVSAECNVGQRATVPCGLNRRGEKSRGCTAGSWGQWGACRDPDECVDGKREPCGSSEGECIPGQRICSEGRWPEVCAGSRGAVPESCDGLDNDCDGAADEGFQECVRCGDARVPAGWSCIPAGEFEMGSPRGETGRNADEVTHDVVLTRSFLMLRTETTVEQVLAVTGAELSPGPECDINCPAQSMTWDAVTNYLNRLSQNEGYPPCYGPAGEASDPDCQGYRLPTEAEWEYAARAGRTGALTPAELSEAAWCGQGDLAPHAVQQKTPNAWNLYDMLGNVHEFTDDLYEPYEGDAVDPLGTAIGRRVIRGGSASDDAETCRPAYRGSMPADASYGNVGFRPVRTLPR